MSPSSLLSFLIVAFSLRLFLSLSSNTILSFPSHQYSPIPHSLKSLKESLYIESAGGLSAYESPITYQLPLTLSLFKLIPSFLTHPFVIALDIGTALILWKFSRRVFGYWGQQQKNAGRIAASTAKKMPNLILLVYLFNPLQIASAAAGSLISLRNFLLALLMYQSVKAAGSNTSNAPARRAMFYLALVVYLDWNYVILLGGILLLLKNGVDDYFGGRSEGYEDNEDDSITSSSEEKSTKRGSAFVLEMIIWFLIWISFLMAASFYAAGGSWKWIHHVYGRIFLVEDLSPNWGNHWYFFTEVFDHFRTYFLLVFNGHYFAYVIPLLLKFKGQPVFLTVIQISILSVFSAYPSFGGIFFALTLLLLFVHLTKYTRYTFVLMLFCVYTSVSGPAFFKTWIYTGTGNANFFYFMTLGFVLSQVMLIVEAVLGMLRWQVDAERLGDQKKKSLKAE